MGNADLPYFPFYPNDFASDGVVEAMTTEAVGAYILLLCKAWREEPPGSIPMDDKTLARWTRLSSDRWAECRPMVLAAFMPGNDNRLHQKRMRQEHDLLRVRSAKRSSAGKSGAAIRWPKNGNRIANASDCHSNGNAVAMPFDSKSETESESEKRVRKREKTRARDEPDPTEPAAPPVSLSFSPDSLSFSPDSEDLSDEGERAAATAAFDQWSMISRGYSLKSHENEHSAVWRMLEVVAQSPPLLVGGRQVLRHRLVPQAVEAMKDKPFKTIKFACGCVRNKLEDWAQSGIPGDGSGNDRRDVQKVARREKSRRILLGNHEEKP